LQEQKERFYLFLSDKLSSDDDRIGFCCTPLLFVAGTRIDRRVTRDSLIASLESEESTADVSIRSVSVIPF